ncbi:unnamed protein product [[Candida] boidinii]|nr:unnamed protein product [[Candida] boidinii]
MIHKNLYVLALTKHDSNIFNILCYLNNLIKVMESYVKSLEEESIRDNFSIIYELLDEMMDYGIPQITDEKILKEYITQKSFTLEEFIGKTMAKSNAYNKKTNHSRASIPPSTLTNSINWRSPGIIYKKNEAYLDVIESIDMLINSKGQMLNSEIFGKIQLKSYLSGMPELILGLNEKFIQGGIASINGDNILKNENGGSTTTANNNNNKNKIDVEDVKFHQCYIQQV